jgi:hypothetical protein
MESKGPTGLFTLCLPALLLNSLIKNRKYVNSHAQTINKPITMVLWKTGIILSKYFRNTYNPLVQLQFIICNKYIFIHTKR